MISIRSLICQKKSVNRITRFFWHSFVVEYRDVLGQSPHLASLRTFIQWSPHFWKTAARALIRGFFSLVSCTRLSTRKSWWPSSWWWIQKWLNCYVFFFFYGQYLPSLNTNYLAINKDMELRLPQLYYTKMKNCCKQCYILTSAPVHDCGKNSRCREIPLQGK